MNTTTPTTKPRPSRAIRRAHEARILALVAERNECLARDTAVGRLMAASIAQDIVNIGRAFAAQYEVG